MKKRGRPKRAPDADQTDFEQDGTAGTTWDACMYFYDDSDVPESCGGMGRHVATIEVPLATVDVMWRRDLNAALIYANMVIAPAEHPMSRGCFVTMPLVLCDYHRNLLAPG